MAHIISQQLKGTGVALVTPFNQDASIDFDGLKKLVHHLVDNGVNYLVILGTTGESPTISKQEKQSILETIRTENNGRLPLVLGIGGNHTLEVAEIIKYQDLDGISALLSVSPYYNKPNQQGIIKHYTHLADKSPLPLLLYNVPGRTGSNISTETTLKLAEHPNILGTKEASGNFTQCMDILKNRPDNFAVISGDDALTHPFLSLGMDGVISVIANAYPKIFSEMVRLGLEGQFQEALPLHNQLLDAMNLIFADGSPGGIKVIMEALGICGTTVRMPLHDVSDKVRQALLETMTASAR
ncbi:MAG: 4-hydroxy-tetrahydrodipicolinate synthase [Bacteroidia bacterium]|nr:4-hydroxy-tetrahydrodipicolinate synthase [Bacteroidia bacterium]